MIRGIKFASIPVVNQDKALAFYTEKLGFKILTDQPFDEKQRWLELGIPGAQTRVVLFRMEGSLEPGMRTNLSFWTDDVEGTARDLKAKGVKFTAEPTKAEWGSFAVFQDIDGNSFVLSSG